ncbi:MAG: hypothetical protein HQ538_06645 [Parcubacteria group bacterium]|nr:hypothetical protein [Parcubacteria group bacterium]
MTKKVSVHNFGGGCTGVLTSDVEKGEHEAELFDGKGDCVNRLSVRVITSRKGPVHAANAALDDFYGRMEGKWESAPWRRKEKPN